MTSLLETDLRSLVRELIIEVLPDVLHGSGSGVEVRNVSIVNDADLAAFVDALLKLAGDRAATERYRSGSLRFKWQPQQANAEAMLPNVVPATQQPLGASTPPSGLADTEVPRAVRRIDKGAVTERMIEQAAAENITIVLGKGAVVTPLARESARKSNVSLERLP